MNLVSLDSSTVRPDTREFDILAQVVPALSAKETLLAGHLGLDADSVPCSARQ